jgi:class 3 adenylate cyclase
MPGPFVSNPRPVSADEGEHRSSGVVAGARYIPRHMAELPTGTVTFLFTDIEGSTRLLQELGEGYAAARVGWR